VNTAPANVSEDDFADRVWERMRNRIGKLSHRQIDAACDAIMAAYDAGESAEVAARLADAAVNRC